MTKNKKWPSYLRLVSDPDDIVDTLIKAEDDFDILGIWYTLDGRIAVINEMDNNGWLTGVVSRNGRVYQVTWDSNMNSVAPFSRIDNLSIKR